MQTERQPVEQPQQFQSLPEFSLEESNQIQSELLAEEFGDASDEWVRENLEEFRERSKNFKEVIKAHSELVDVYHRNPEEFKKRIKQLLGQKPTLH